jgi:hypothetical protein
MSKGRSYGIAALLVAAGLALAGCQASAQGADEPPAEVASVETPADGGPGIITLSEAAEGRLAMDTTPVAAGPAGLLVPYAALVYDTEGATWVFVRTAPFTYQRALVVTSGKVGDQVALSSGPPVGTEVVTVGAPELVGVETGIDGEE